MGTLVLYSLPKAPRGDLCFGAVAVRGGARRSQLASGQRPPRSRSSFLTITPVLFSHHSCNPAPWAWAGPVLVPLYGGEPTCLMSSSKPGAGHCSAGSQEMLQSHRTLLFPAAPGSLSHSFEAMPPPFQARLEHPLPLLFFFFSVSRNDFFFINFAFLACLSYFLPDWVFN